VIQIGAPEGESLKEGLAPPRTFLAIRGLSHNYLTIYSIIVAESYSESPITAFGLRPSYFLIKLNGERTTLVPLTLARRVISTRGNSDTAAFIIWLRYPQKNSTFFFPEGEGCEYI